MTDALLASALLGIKGKPKHEAQDILVGHKEQISPSLAISMPPSPSQSQCSNFMHPSKKDRNVALLDILEKARHSSTVLSQQSAPQVEHIPYVNKVPRLESSMLLPAGTGSMFPLSSTQCPLGMDNYLGNSLNSHSASNHASVQSFKSTNTTPEAIRKEQIERALHSKPQRGKKRENLTESERLELTRTRNREHARSTRNRKKARYEELLAKEEHLDKLEQQLRLDQARRQTVVDFLGVRQQMVRQLGRSPTSAPLPEGGITHIVDDLDAFVFHDENGDTQEIRGLQGMGRFDEKLISRTEDRFGSEATSLLTYTKSLKSVALGLDDRASIDVELTIQGHTNLSLLTANLQVTFSPGSSKICSVEWRTIRDQLDEVPVDQLKVQRSYPSVVSLDPVMETISSIGMDI